MKNQAMPMPQGGAPMPQGGAPMPQGGGMPPQMAQMMAMRQGGKQRGMPPPQGAGLPPGIDPRAVAADPQGFAKWQQGKAAQDAMMGGGPPPQGMAPSQRMGPGQGMPMQRPGLPPAAQQAMAQAMALRQRQA